MFTRLRVAATPALNAAAVDAAMKTMPAVADWFDFKFDAATSNWKSAVKAFGLVKAVFPDTIKPLRAYRMMSVPASKAGLVKPGELVTANKPIQSWTTSAKSAIQFMESWLRNLDDNGAKLKSQRFFIVEADLSVDQILWTPDTARAVLKLVGDPGVKAKWGFEANQIRAQEETLTVEQEVVAIFPTKAAQVVKVTALDPDWTDHPYGYGPDASTGPFSWDMVSGKKVLVVADDVPAKNALIAALKAQGGEYVAVPRIADCWIVDPKARVALANYDIPGPVLDFDAFSKWASGPGKDAPAFKKLDVKHEIPLPKTKPGEIYKGPFSWGMFAGHVVWIQKPKMNDFTIKQIMARNGVVMDPSSAIDVWISAGRPCPYPGAPKVPATVIDFDSFETWLWKNS